MSIYDMTKRTKTYLAGDWTGDKDLIDKLMNGMVQNLYEI